MLTILAWIIFIPALIFNIFLWLTILLAVLLDDRRIKFTNKDFVNTATIVIIGMIILWIPGIYLFGVF